MPRYINWGDVVDRYTKISEKYGAEEVDSAYLQYAENFVEGRLSVRYDIPFGSDNLTVKDLCIDAVMAKALAYKDTAKSESIMNKVNGRIDSILMGKENMITISGTVIDPGKDPTWFEGSDYNPIFGLGDIEDFVVSSERLQDEADAR